MKNFIDFNKQFEHYKLARELDKKKGTKITYRRDGGIDEKGRYTQDFGNSGDNFIRNIDDSIKQAKIFRVDNNIKKLLSLTTVPNKNDKVRLPYPYMFIDVNFKKTEMDKIGIDIGYDEIMGVLFSEGILINKEKETVGKDLRITIVSQVGKEVWFDTFNVNCDIVDKYKDLKVKIQKCDSTKNEARNFIHLFVLAFLNFVNNPEVEIIKVDYGEKKNEKRISKGKVPIPLSHIIRLDGKLKKYVDSLSSDGSFEFHHRFWVRGHFRTLRDEKYGKGQGRRIWLLPYIKGKGVLIDKEYAVK